MSSKSRKPRTSEEFDEAPSSEGPVFLPGLTRRGSLVKRVEIKPAIEWMKRVTNVPIRAKWPYDQEITAYARIEGHRGLEAVVTFRSRSDRRVVGEVIVRPTNRDDASALASGGVTVDAVRAVRLGKIQDEVSEIV